MVILIFRGFEDHLHCRVNVKISHLVDTFIINIIVKFSGS